MKPVNKPWGSYTTILHRPNMWFKILEINPGSQFSLQRHSSRWERWLVVHGSGTATVGDRQIRVKKGDEVKVERNEIHRLTAGKEGLIVAELGYGFDVREDDIERLEDDYGRS